MATFDYTDQKKAQILFKIGSVESLVNEEFYERHKNP